MSNKYARYGNLCSCLFKGIAISNCRKTIIRNRNRPMSCGYIDPDFPNAFRNSDLLPFIAFPYGKVELFSQSYKFVVCHACKVNLFFFSKPACYTQTHHQQARQQFLHMDTSHK